MPIAEPASGLIFALEVDGAQMALFRTCSDLGSTSEVLEQKTTAADGTIVIRKLPGKLTWSNLVLERGVERSAKLWNWRQLVVDGKVAEARKEWRRRGHEPGGRIADAVGLRQWLALWMAGFLHRGRQRAGGRTAGNRP